MLPNNQFRSIICQSRAVATIPFVIGHYRVKWTYAMESCWVIILSENY